MLKKAGEKCAKCLKALQKGVFCIQCKVWLHNKCEHIDPNQNHEGYVCKSCSKSLEKPFEKHLFASTNDQETARNTVGNTIDEISTLKSENSVLRERVLVLEDLLSARDTKITHYVAELENLRQKLKEALDKNTESQPLTTADRTPSTAAKDNQPGQPNLKNFTTQNMLNLEFVASVAHAKIEAYSPAAQANAWTQQMKNMKMVEDPYANRSVDVRKSDEAVWSFRLTANLVFESVQKNESVLLFCNTREACVNMCDALIKVHHSLLRYAPHPFSYISFVNL